MAAGYSGAISPLRRLQGRYFDRRDASSRRRPKARAKSFSAGGGGLGGGAGRGRALWRACAGDEAAEPLVVQAYFGIDAQLVRKLSTKGDDHAVVRHLAAIRNLGVGFVRANVDWVSLEPLPPTPAGRSYDFTTHDRLGGAARYQRASLADHRHWGDHAGLESTHEERSSSRRILDLPRAQIRRTRNIGSAWRTPRLRPPIRPRSSNGKASRA